MSPKILGIVYPTLAETPVLTGPLPTISDAYAAGLVDGEGCIGITRNGKYYEPRIDVGMTAKALPLLQALHARYGGNLYLWRKRTEKWDDVWRWCIYQRAVLRGALNAWLPHLVLKKPQAEKVLEFIVLLDKVASMPAYSKGFKGRHVVWTPEYKQEAVVLHAQLKELNRKGPPS